MGETALLIDKETWKILWSQTTTEEWNRARQNTENTTQLDLPVQDIFAENSANGFDPVTVEGKDFKLLTLTVCHLMNQQIFCVIMFWRHVSLTVCHLMNQQIFCVIMFWRHVSKSTLPNVLWFSHKCLRPDHCQWGSCFGKGITFPAYEWLSCWVITERRTRWKEQCQNLLNIKFISALNFTSWNKTLFTYNWYLRSKSDLLLFEGFYTSSP